MRTHNQPSPRRVWRVLRRLILAGLVLSAVMALALAGLFWWYGRGDLPELTSLAAYQPKQVTVVLDKDKRRVGELFEDDGRRTFVAYDAIPKVLVDAFIAAEDQKYWTHGGIDYIGMVRAALANLKSRHSKQGASTITQQVVKTFLLSPEKTFKRKIQEIILARRLEQNLTKAEILTLYLNQINLGHGRYGIVEAARFYFGKELAALTPGDAAVLAALPKSPTNISPRTNPERAKERQAYVLRNMVVMGKLTQAEAQRWIDAPIQLVKDPYPGLGSAPEWVDVARTALKNLGHDGWATKGGQVRTTVDAALQTQARAALQKALRALDKRHKIGGTRKKHAADAIAAELKKLAKRHRGKIKPNERYQAIVMDVSDKPAQLRVDLGGWPATLLLGDEADDRYNQPNEQGKRKLPTERFGRGDELTVIALPDAMVDEPKASSVERGAEAARKAVATKAGKPVEEEDTPHLQKEHRAQLVGGPQGAVVVLEIKTRKVRAMVGGYTMNLAGFNRAVAAKRQPGSAFKPLVYGAAIEAGLATPARVVNDAPEVYDVWKPQNYEKGKFEGPVRLRYALAKSINTVAIRMCHEATPARVIDLATRLGIAGPLPNEMALALGAGEVTPLEMANAFATLAGGGRYRAPTFLEEVNGQAVPLVAETEVLRPEVAYVVTEMMRSVVDEGTGYRAKVLGVPVAGKTGTSNDSRDVWFVGATAEYVIAVWIGNDDNTPMPRETGGTTAVPVFVDVAKSLSLAKRGFERPPGVVEVLIDKATGLLAAPGASSSAVATEVFVEGTAPTDVAPLPDEVTPENLVTSEYED